MAFTPEVYPMTDQIFYRALRPSWAFAPLSGKGAAVNGGRWNAKGQSALYLAGDPMTALAEYNQDLLFRPVTLAQYLIKDATLADLLSPDLVTDYPIDDAAINCDWYRLSLERKEVPTWTIAGELAAKGFEGISYPSRINGAPCVCLWRWNEPDHCAVTVTDIDGRLPQDNRSWPTL